MSPKSHAAGRASTPRLNGYLSIAEYHALYIALPADRREYLQAFCGLGARDSELYRITPVDVEPNAGRVRIPGTKTEAAERWLQPPPELFEILVRRSEVTPLGQPIFRSGSTCGAPSRAPPSALGSPG